MSTRTLLLAVVLFLPFANVADAWMRWPYEDAQVVERSELVVVARLKPESIRFFDHGRTKSDRTHYYEATLVISSVLKGEYDQRELPIILNYGLTPLVAGRLVNQLLEPANAKRDPNAVVEIADSGGDRDLVLENAQTDNLWFICKRSGYRGDDIGSGSYGVTDPEEMQPLKLKDYYQCYLSDEPEKAVREYLSRPHPKITERGQRYLDHLEVMRILALQDPQLRFDKLLPYFVKRTSWAGQWSTDEGIVGCGSLAAAPLIPIFNDPPDERLRDNILRIWRDIGDPSVVLTLIALLEKHNRYASTQQFAEGWWNDMSDPALEKRRTAYGESSYAISALRAIGDRQAIPVIKQTKQLWSRFDFEPTDIAQECDKTLRDWHLEP